MGQDIAKALTLSSPSYSSDLEGILSSDMTNFDILSLFFNFFDMQGYFGSMVPFQRDIMNIILQRGSSVLGDRFIFRAHFTVLYSGNIDEDIGTRTSFFKIFKESLKVNVLCFDYPGFGLHQDHDDRWNEFSYYDCLLKAYKWLITVKNTPEKKIILFGLFLIYLF